MSKNGKATIPAMGEAFSCPVKVETAKLKELGRGMVKAIRRLRRSLTHCARCEFEDSCEFRKSFNNQVDSVVQEIWDEWNQGREGG